MKEISPVMPSEVLKATLVCNLKIPMKSEKAKAGLIVMPILVEIWDINQNFKPRSGFSFNVDASKGLKGICDFLISAKPHTAKL